MSMVEARGLTFAYGSSETPALRDVCLRVEEGEMVVLAGPSGGGKSTLLRSLNGLVPHFHGGAFGGEVRLNGVDTRERQPRDLAAYAGMVFQEPEAQTVARTVEDEIVFGMENFGLEPKLIRRRLEELLDALSLAHLRARELVTLSGGERQRVAIASVMGMQPHVLLLDEPTSQLDPQSAQDVLAKVMELRDEMGLIVMVAEHRLERLAGHADRVIVVERDGAARVMCPREAMLVDGVPAPPVARIGAAAGWSPLPLTLVEGRRFVRRSVGSGGVRVDRRPTSAGGDVMVSAHGVHVELGRASVLRGVDLALRGGEIVALMGRNGAGKTTLLRTLAGLVGPSRGKAEFASEIDPRSLYRHMAYVAQDPASMLYRATLREEIGDVLGGTKRAGSAEDALAEWDLASMSERNPRDLSVGERQRVALAAMLAGGPEIILLDEPTRGMDAVTAEMLVENLRRRRDAGACVVLASHDVELAARCADRVVLLADGEVIDDGPPTTVLTGSLAFSTQANKLFGGDVLTVEDGIAAALGGGVGQ